MGENFLIVNITFYFTLLFSLNKYCLLYYQSYSYNIDNINNASQLSQSRKDSTFFFCKFTQNIYWFNSDLTYQDKGKVLRVRFAAIIEMYLLRKAEIKDLIEF